MTREDFLNDLGQSDIPIHMQGGVRRYVMRGVPPGDFLSNLISNDLRRTFERADSENQCRVMDYLKLFYSSAPSQCWGSPQRFSDWIKVGGWDGLEAQRAAQAAEQEG